MTRTQQIVVTEDSITSNNGTINNQNIAPNDPIDNLIGQQTKIFEELGKRLCIELQTSYREYLKHESIKNSAEIDKVCKKYEDKIDSQSKLIDSLRARIEQLETETIIKNQDIKKLGQETSELRKDIQLILGHNDKQPVQSQDIMKDASSLKDENGKASKMDEPLTTASSTFEALEDKDLDVREELSDEDDYEEEFTEIPYVLCDGKLYYKEGMTEPSAYVQPSSENDSIDQNSKLKATSHSLLISSINNAEIELKHELIELRSLKTQNSLINISNAEQKIMQRLIKYRSLKNKMIRKPQNENNLNSSKLMQTFHSKIKEKLDRVNSKGQHQTKSNDFTTLVEKIPVKFLLEYEESNEFQSLDGNSQKHIKLIINEKLKDEVNDVTKKVSQSFNVYSDRKIFPPL